MKYRRALATTALLAAASLTATACSSPATAPSSSGSSAAAKPTGTLNFVNDKSWDFKAFS